jgi:hypothetical protein
VGYKFSENSAQSYYKIQKVKKTPRNQFPIKVLSIFVQEIIKCKTNEAVFGISY